MKTVIFTVISESIPTCSNETLELDKIYKIIEECRWTTGESQLKFLQQNIIAVSYTHLFTNKQTIVFPSFV